MAKKRSDGVNKSQAIRDALGKDPNISPSALSEQLIAQGINVTPAYISMIKSGMKAKGKVGKRGRPARQATGSISTDDLLETKKLVDRVGGIEKVESLLGTLKKLR